MPETRTPLRLLIAVPQAARRTAPSILERAAAALTAAEAQGDLLTIEWLRPPTWAHLSARLITAPNVDILWVVAPLADGAVLWPDATTSPAELLAAGRGLALTALLACDVEAPAGLPLADGNALFLDGRATPAQTQDALLVLLSELLAGEPVAVACESAARALAPAEQLLRWAAAPARATPVRPQSGDGSGVARVVPFPEAGLLPAWRRLPQQPVPGGLPELPDALLVGHTAERIALEAALLDDERRITCLHGPVGRGKTALAAATARWLVRTGAYERVIYSSLAGGLLPDTLVYDLSWQLLGPEANLMDAETGAQMTAALAAAPTLLIWDGIEAAFSPDVVGYDDGARMRLLGLARELAHVPGCRLLLISDSATCPPELETLGATPFTLAELDAADSTALLGALLPGDRTPAPEMLGPIHALLGGNPLALRCAATRLAAVSPAMLLAESERLLPGAAQGAARLGEQSVALGIELLLAELSPDERLAVNALGLYARGFMEPMTLRTVGLSEDVWAHLKPALLQAGLLVEEHVAGLNIPRLALHPALSGHLARRVTPRQRRVLANAYGQTEAGLLAWLPRAEGQVPGLARRLLRLELANLAMALDLAVAGDELNLAAELAEAAGAPLGGLGLDLSATALRQRVDRAAAAAIPREGPLSRPAVQFALRQSERLLQTGHAEQGITLLQGLVKRVTVEKGQSYGPPEAILDQGLAVKLLASALRVSPRPELAVTTLRQALALLAQARSLPEARLAEAQAWHDLAELLLGARQADAAEEAAQRGLDLAQPLEERALIGALQNQLGAVAILRGDAALALERLRQAADSLNAAQSWAALCNVWGQIAAVHETARNDLPTASEALSRAIAVATAADLPALRGQMLMQRARLQARLDQPALAEADLEGAAQLYRQAQQPAALIAALRALAELALEQGQPAKAERHAEAARQVGEAVASGAAPWEVYLLLQRIARARDDAEAVATWRRRTQQAFARSAAAPAVIQQWFGLIRAVAESCRGSSLSGEVAALVEKIETSEQGRALADAIWAVLGGAREPKVYDELDHVSALIVRTILHGIAHPEMFERTPARTDATSGAVNSGASPPSVPPAGG